MFKRSSHAINFELFYNLLQRWENKDYRPIYNTPNLREDRKPLIMSKSIEKKPSIYESQEIEQYEIAHIDSPEEDNLCV